LKKNEREKIRVQYRPRKVRTLFVGESPPASGRFFYNRDSGLYRAVRDTFRKVDKSVTEETFLALFQKAGCYLIDLCGEPVDRMKPAARRKACRDGEAQLSRQIRKLQPEIIVVLVRSIRKNVERGTLRASWHGELISVPYPGRWIQHRRVFERMLVPRIKSLFRLVKKKA
jgi:hypothetical protein